MDIEVLRLFGIFPDEDPDEVPEPTEFNDSSLSKQYVPNVYINGRKLLRRWTAITGTMTIQNKRYEPVQQLSMILIDELTGRIRLKRQKITYICQSVKDRSVYIGLVNPRKYSGDLGDLFHYSKRSMQMHRDIELLKAAGGMGEYTYKQNCLLERLELECKKIDWVTGEEVDL